MLALLLGIGASLLPGATLSVAALLGVGIAGGAFAFVPHLLRLRERVSERMNRADRNPAFDREFALTPYLVYPLVFSMLLLPFSWLAPLVFWSVYLLYMGVLSVTGAR